MLDRPEAYTVSAITRMIKGSLEEQFSDIWVEGEISGYHHHTSGHRYLNLKDENAVLRTVIWRSVGASLKFEPENGQKVLAFGNISVYEKGGQYQLTCRKLVPVGVGPLELAFRQLFERLSHEGLFDDDRKQQMPAYPLTVGIVTSPTGAAIRDIVQVSVRRNDTVQLVIFPAQVQGDGAEVTIAAGISYFNTRDDIDIVIIGRGGGSLEDLWPFNTETTVRAIAASRIPVVSAVGHEIDTTLSDLAADLRAPTPSAAAELVVWSRNELLERLDAYLSEQINLLQSRIQKERRGLRSQTDRPVFRRPLDIVDQRRQYLDGLFRLLCSSGKNRFDQARNRLSLELARLETLSPLRILARGYSVTLAGETGLVLKSVRQLNAGQRVETVLADGRFDSLVEHVHKGKGASNGK